MAEKFYIVTNEKFLKEIEDYIKNEAKEKAFISEYFKEKGIAGERYLIRGNGSVNVPFTEKEKKDICLYIEDNEENNKNFGKQLKKAVNFDDGTKMREFRKTSELLKEFQEACVEKEIVINLWWHREGDYFKELRYYGYSLTRFMHDGKYYLKIASSQVDTITPLYEGFNEIKGSEFYAAVEKKEEEKK